MFTTSDWSAETFESGHGTVSYKVDGFWSRDTVTVRMSRRSAWTDDDVDWVADISWSTGGRESGYDVIEAARNHACAVNHAVMVAGELVKMKPELEAAYQAYAADAKAQRERELDEQRAKVEADDPIGEGKARVIAEYLVAEGGRLEVIERGAEGHRRGETVTARVGDKTVFYYAGSRCSKRNAINLIADLSARSKLLTPKSEIVSI